jgi:uncharacterized membrane protein YcaP (DUF421 family)
MTEQLGTDPVTALQVVIATVGMVLALLVLVRIGGQRSLATMSTTDLACVVALGAVVGRTMLLAVPTLVAGVIALVVLFGLRLLLSQVQRTRLGAVLAPQPVVLMADGQVIEAAMRRACVADDELRQRLRLAGITARTQVRLAVLERTGEISVITAAAGECEPWMQEDLPRSDARM